MSIATPNNRFWLPRTGQTTVQAVGDDGHFQAGNPRATRFIDNGNGTVSDRATGLMWVKQPELIIPGAVGVHTTNQVQRVGPNYGGGVGVWVTVSAYLSADLVTTGGLFYVCAAGHTSGDFATDLAAGKWRKTIWTASAADLIHPATFDWEHAVYYSLGTKWNPTTGLSYAGYSDWRLPNRSELVSMFDMGCTPSCLNTDAFGVARYPYKYWTSTWRNYTSYYVSVYFANGGTVDSSLATTLYLARPVRGGRINANG